MRDRAKSKMTPRLLGEAAGIMELPVTEMGKVGRGAVLNVFYFIIICLRWGDVEVRHLVLDVMTLRCVLDVQAEMLNRHVDIGLGVYRGRELS